MIDCLKQPCLFVIFLCLSGFVSANNTDLKLELSSLSEEQLRIQLTLSNLSSEPVQILAWNTPFVSNYSGDSFLVYRPEQPGDKVAYTGALKKRGAPQISDFIQLNPGASLTAEVNIADFYAIDAIAEYRIRFQAYIDIISNQGSESIKLISNTLSAYQARLSQALPQPRIRLDNSCNATENNQINQALTAARSLATESLQALNDTAEADRANALRYTTWFGSYTNSRYNRVNENFSGIVNALEQPEISFICHSAECDPGTFAFVYPRSHYEVYLCDGFWNADLNGTDSRAGTIIHEVSHFRVVSDTDDHQYGQAGSRQLAISQPDVAITNADNYEYFAENEPFLVMSGGSGQQSPEPVSTDDIQALSLDTPISGSIGSGDFMYYRITGASSIRLYGLSSDLDLYVAVNEAPGLDQFNCRPFLPASNEETCDVNPADSVVIGVYGYQAGQFSLVASSSGQGISTTSTVLTLENPVNGTVNESEFTFFQVNGASSIRLYDLTADLDLYIGEGQEPGLNSFQCRPFLPELEQEVCEVDSTELTYIGIYGFEAGNFSLVAEVGTSNTMDSTENSETLVPGTSVNASLQRQEWAYFDVTGATNIRLFNLTADMDLYVNSNSHPDLSQYQCRPFLSGQIEENCRIASQGISYIGVYGYEAGGFSLLAEGVVDSAVSTRVVLNQNDFFRGESFRLSVLINGSGRYDNYVGVFYPDGSLYTFSQPFILNPRNSILPYQSNFTVNGEENYSILDVALPMSLPLGQYRACSLLLPAGRSLAEENWLSLDCLEFDIR